MTRAKEELYVMAPETEIEFGEIRYEQQKRKRQTNNGKSHYKDCPIQPIDYIVWIISLDWCEGNIIKYVTRHNKKGEKVKKTLKK